MAALMAHRAALLLLLLMPLRAAAAIARVDAVTNTALGGSVTFTLNVPTAPSRNAITVQIVGLGSSSITFSGTVNGVPMGVLATRGSAGAAGATAVLGLVDNTGVNIRQGSNTIQVQGTGLPSAIFGSAAAWTGVGPLSALSSSALSNTASSSVFLSVNKAGSVVVDTLLCQLCGSATPGAGQTLLGTSNTTGNYAWASSKSAASSTSVTWSWGTPTSWVAAATVLEPAGATRITFPTPPPTLTAGDCSGAVLVRLTDDSSVAQNGGPTVVTLAPSDPGMQLFADGSCGGSAVTQVTVASNTPDATFSYRTNNAGNHTLAGSSTGMTGATANAPVNPGPAVKLLITSAPASLVAGECSGPLTVRPADSFDNPTASGSDRTLALSSSSPGAIFYSDSGCGTAVTTLPIATAATSASFWIRDPRAGSNTVTVSSAGLSPDATRSLPVSPAAIARLVFTSGAQSLTAGDCSGPVTVEGRDAFNNTTTAGVDRALALSSPSSGVTFYSDACTTPVLSVPMLAAASSATFRFRDTVAGSRAMTVSSAGLSPHATQSYAIITGQGGGCAQSLECASGFCTDGVCCDTRCGDGALDDCQACSVSAGAGVDGVCALLPAAAVCRPSQSASCDPDEERCDGTSAVCPADDFRPVRVVRDAVLTAAAGRDYRYNAQGRVEAIDANGPVAFSRCAPAPAGFQVDGTTGAVAWRPAEEGAVGLCVRAEDRCGGDSYGFGVTVGTASQPPTAVARFSPEAPGAGDTVAFDGTASTGALVAHAWSFGDGARGYGAQTAHVYPRGGSYGGTLTVHDGLAGSAEARFDVPVTDAVCAAPTPVRIVVNILLAADILDAELSCTGCEGRALRWTFSDGTVSTEERPRKQFGPGRHRIKLLAVSRTGCRALDEGEVSLTAGSLEPPRCHIETDVVTGSAPFRAELRAHAVDPNPGGSITELRWLEGDEQTAAITRELSAPGRVLIRLRATGGSGLTCEDALWLEALGEGLPPEVEHPPGRYWVGCGCGQAGALAAWALLLLGGLRVRQRRTFRHRPAAAAPGSIPSPPPGC
jgi:hypothetical protein